MKYFDLKSFLTSQAPESTNMTDLLWSLFDNFCSELSKKRNSYLAQ